MRSRRTFLIALSLLVLSIAAATHWWSRSHTEDAHAVGYDTIASLSGRIIPEFNLENASLDDAIAAVNLELQKDSELRRYNIARWTEKSPPKGFYPEIPTSVVPIPGIEDLPLTQAHSAGTDPATGSFSLSLQNVPAYEVILYMSALADCSIGQQGSTIWLVAGKGEFGPMVKRVYRGVNSAFFTFWPTAPPPSASRKQDITPWLREQGVKMPTGATAYYYPGSRVLSVRSTQVDIDLCDAMMSPGCYLGRDLSTVPGWERAWIYVQDWAGYYSGKVRERTDLLFY